MFEIFTPKMFRLRMGLTMRRVTMEANYWKWVRVTVRVSERETGYRVPRGREAPVAQGVWGQATQAITWASTSVASLVSTFCP